MARTFQWRAADGSQLLTLDAASGYRLQDATTGLTSPSYRVPTERYAGLDGARVQSVTADGREIELALLVQGTTREQFRSRVTALVRAMRPKAGPGTLIVTDEDGVTRSLTCYYTGGLEGSEADGTKLADRWWKAVVKLLAEDPWFYGEQIDLPFLLGPPPQFFPIFPLRFAPTEIAGAIPVDNVGDEDAYPVWRVDGPGNGLLLGNDTTGKSLELSTVLPAGRFLTIDTRPFFQSVLLDDGTNLFGDLTSDPAMWVLVPGTNAVSVMLSGASGASRVTGSYRPRYAGIT